MRGLRSTATRGRRRPRSSRSIRTWRALGRLIGGHVVLASVVVSLAACLGSFVLLHRLTNDLAGREVADGAVLYLAVFPTALFLQAAYAESLFLLLALATFVLAERGRLVWTGAACGLALLTRPSGIAVLAAVAVFAVRGREWKRGAAAIAVSLALFCLYPLLLWSQHRDPLAFAAAQHHWGRRFSPLGPVVAVVGSVAMTVLYAASFVAPPPARYGRAARSQSARPISAPAPKGAYSLWPDSAT
jgi:hypothetical protein